MRVSDQIIDLARAAGYEGIAAVTIAAETIRAFKDSGEESKTYTIGKGATAQSFTLTRPSIDS